MNNLKKTWAEESDSSVSYLEWLESKAKLALKIENLVLIEAEEEDLDLSDIGEIVQQEILG